ncbi:MAG TPA: TonB-dependent receptor, partial [Bacteroidota bacterium]|nr:TonB-dependent receptor [Bacteroidota bacterium]
MRQPWYRFPLCLLLALLMAGVANAGNGKISGVVRDADLQAVVGANVVIEGTTLGASVDLEGKYFILNVPPGSYRLRSSAVGFAPSVVAGVIVGQDQIVTVNFTLRSEAVGLSEVVVQAERPIVDKSQTSSKSTLRSEEIQNLPVRSAVGLVATSASAFNGFIRGGRVTETKTIVDGVDVSDQYYAYEADVYHTPFRTYNSVPRYQNAQLSKVGGLNFSAVEEMNINTGAVGAEYSSATAGVINYSLREGRGAMKGNFFARVSQFNGLSYNGPDIFWDKDIYFAEQYTLNRRVDSLRGLRSSGAPASAFSTIGSDSARLGRYTYYDGKYIKESPQMEFEGSLGGDITEDWGFYFTGKYFNSYGRLPNEFNREVNLTLKSNYNISGDMKLSGFGIVTDRGKLFGWKNRGYQEGSRFFLEGTPKNDGADIIGSLKWTHVIDPSSFYEVQASIVDNVTRTGYSDDNGDGFCAIEEDGDFLTMSTLAEANKYISNADLTKFFRNQDEQASSTSYAFQAGNTTARLSRPAFYYEDFKNTVLTFKGDYTNQVTDNHRIQAGAQARLTKMDMIRRASFLGALDAKKQFYDEVWTVNPMEMGVYLQDRMEYAGLIINIGARLDMWDPDVNDFTNYFAPYLDQNVSYDTLPGVSTTIKERITQRDRKVDPEWFLSPRIGVSHPISDVAAMYFSYSRNFTPPPYSRMYASFNNFGNLSLPNNPSVRQEPYRSNNYEIGVQWEFLPKFGLNFTAYLRDIENYGYYSFNVVPRSGAYGTTYYLGYSTGYADSRGVEVTLSAQRHQLFDLITLTTQASYAYTYIKASGFAGLDKTMQTSFSTANGDSARLSGNLPFEDVMFYNKVQNNVVGGASTLTGGFDRTHRITYQLVLGFPEDITLSSVGTFQSGFFYALRNVDPRTVGRELGEAPWNKNV